MPIVKMDRRDFAAILLPPLSGMLAPRPNTAIDGTWSGATPFPYTDRALGGVMADDTIRLQ